MENSNYQAVIEAARKSRVAVLGALVASITAALEASKEAQELLTVAQMHRETFGVIHQSLVEAAQLLKVAHDQAGYEDQVFRAHLAARKLQEDMITRK